MVTQIVGFQPQLDRSCPVDGAPVDLELLPGTGDLRTSKTGEAFGSVPPTLAKILSVLAKDISFQIYADQVVPTVQGPPNAAKRKSTSRKVTRFDFELRVILYGQSKLSEAVGLFAARCHLYLQHPRRCARNVPYNNPHCLSPLDGTVQMTHELDSLTQAALNSDNQILANPIDLFTDSNRQEYIRETSTPDTLKTTLYRHQKQALTFMLGREKGWALDGSHKDIWRQEEDSQGRLLYVNHITGHKQARIPAQFRGGLLIDAPGLGKSLSIISLIATDINSCDSPCQGGNAMRATLLIVPKSRKKKSL